MCSTIQLAVPPFLANRAIYVTAIRDAVPAARGRLWLVTADVKEE